MEKNFTERQQKIILYLRENQIQTGKQLASYLGISLRTLQLDIAEINKMIPLIISDNKGYRLDTDIPFSTYTPMLTPQKQSHVILKKLIMSTKPISLHTLADELYISESTLLRQLKAYASLLSSYQLSIRRKSHQISIEGNELDKRRCINHLINSEVEPFLNDNHCLDAYFPNIDILQMKQLVLKLINHYNCLVDEVYFTNMFLNIVIAFHRMRTGSYVELSSEILIDETKTDYKIAKDLCEFYSKLWRIEPSKEDINYIAVILHGQIKHTAIKDATIQNGIISEQFLNEIDEILMETFHHFMLNIDYKEQLYSFALHINGLLERSQYRQEVVNDLLESLQINSPFIYDVAIMIAEKIVNMYHVSISKEEVGYISIHIGFLIENTLLRDAKEKGMINVLLISSDYYQIEKKISERLKDEFGDQIHILLKKGLDHQLIFNKNIDILITTQPIQIIGKPTVMISPFYTLEDQLKVNEIILQTMKIKEKNMSYQLLASYFHEKLFIKTNTITTRDQAIEFLGKKIIDFGLEKPEFISSLKKRESLSSTCFFNTFAIPHALEMNAKKTMFCVLINEDGIEWDPGKIIHIVVMLSVCKENRKEFMKIYDGIIRSLCDKHKLERIIQAKSFFEFLQQFKE